MANQRKIKPEIVVAIIGGLAAIIVAYFQFVYKPSQTHNSSLTIFGRIVDRSDNPINNVNVLIANTANSTTTDNNGEFSFDLKNFSSNYIRLIVNHPNYKPIENTFSTQGSIKIILDEKGINTNK